MSENPRPVEKAAMGVALGWVVLRHRPYRRNLLFGATLAALLLVFAGAGPLTAWLAARPLVFVLYWSGCLVLVAGVLALALYDLRRVRQEHRRRLAELERELAEAAEEARRLARERQGREDEAREGDPPGDGGGQERGG